LHLLSFGLPRRQGIGTGKSGIPQWTSLIGSRQNVSVSGHKENANPDAVFLMNVPLRRLPSASCP
jgi:hypothetical protein